MKKILLVTGTALAAVAALVLALVLMGPDSDPKTRPSADSSTDATTEPSDDSTAGTPAEPTADLPQGCGDRLVNPEEPIPGRLFARCIAAAQQAANTMRYISDDNGTRAEGWIQINPPRFYLVIEGDEEVRLLRNGDHFWHYGGGRWTKAVEGSSDPAESMAYALYQVAEAVGDPTKGVQTWGTAKDFRRSGSIAEEINGVQTYAYTGLPDSWIPAVELTGLKVWVDAQYRPVRYVGSAKGFGVATTSRMDFFDWGKPVDIPASPADAE